MKWFHIPHNREMQIKITMSYCISTKMIKIKKTANTSIDNKYFHTMLVGVQTDTTSLTHFL